MAKPKSEPFTWSTKETGEFLAVLEKYDKDFGNPKKKKVKIMKAVAEELEEREVAGSPETCMNKWKSLKKATKQWKMQIARWARLPRPAVL